MQTTETVTEAAPVVAVDKLKEGETTPVENPVLEPVEPGSDKTPEAAPAVDNSHIMDSLDQLREGKDSVVSTTGGKVQRVDEKLDKEAKEFKAKIEAAVATGGLATAIEKLLNPVVVTDDMRTDFHESLYPVLMKFDNGVMPDWMAAIWKDWQAEIKLARKAVAIGWAIHEQRRDIKAGKVKPIEKKKRYRLPASATSRKVEEKAAA